MLTFIGRKAELEKLEILSSSIKASMVVIQGRRRIGKSRLVQEFAKDKIFLPFTGLAPIDQLTAQDQRNNFARQLADNFKLPPLTFIDWSDAFAHLSYNLKKTGSTVILLDEISWMSSKDPTFLPKLKAWWDLVLQNQQNVILVLCGSVSIWIEKNIINSTTFFGRISLHINLEELSLPESYKLLKAIGWNASIYDTFKILSLTGGVPWYIEQITYTQTADDNIRRLCFEKKGIFVNEFERIFNDLFSHKGTIYKKIIYTLGEGMCDLAQIRKKVNYPHSGSLTHYIRALTVSGFITCHYTWSIKTGRLRKKNLYRLSDNYIRFFIKYIEPNLPKISQNAYQEINLSSLLGWEVMMGFQVENLLLKNRNLLIKALGLNMADVVADNPYLQSATTRYKGCQVDYLIQTHTNNLFLCEFKFSKREIQPTVIESIKEKIKRLYLPRGFGICPVLVHISGVTNSLHEKRYFYRIIDASQFLENACN